MELEKEISGAQDLRNRERVNFVVDSTLMGKLRELSAKSNVPMSRMIDQAIEKTYGLDMTFSTVIPINHTVKIYIFKEVNSENVNELCNILHSYEKQFILGECLLAKDNKRIIGSLLNFFADDGDEKILNDCVQYLQNNHIVHKVNADGTTISQ